MESQATHRRATHTSCGCYINQGNMSFRVSLLLTFLLFVAFGGLRPNLATTDGRSSTTSNVGSASIIAYWQTMLPHSTMPSAIRDLLTPNIADLSFYGEGINMNIKPSQPVTAFYEKGTNVDGKAYQPVTAFYRKGTDVDNKPYHPVTTFYGKGTNMDGKAYQPVTAFYGKGTDVDNKPYQPVTAFYGKGTDVDTKPYQPVTAFYGKGINVDNRPYQPVTTFYGKGTDVDNKPYQPVTAFYGKGTDVDNKPYQPVTAFYEKGSDVDNKPYQPVTAFYGKGTDVDNKPYQPVTAFYGKGTDVDNKPYQPVTAFYEKGSDVDNKPYQPVTAFYGKGTDVDNKPYQPVTAFYEKGSDVDNKPYQPVTAFYGKGTDVYNKPYQPVTAFYGKGTDEDTKAYQPVTAFYAKRTDLDNKPYEPVTTFYGKGTHEDGEPNQPVTAFYGKETNGPVHMSMTNMADSDHMDDGHDNFGLRNISFLFLEDALTPGSKVAPYIDPVSSRAAPLLPRDVVGSIPMSVKSFTDILRMFAPASRAMAESIWHSLEVCEHPRPVKGEKRGCVTSIESMIDFVASTLRTSDLRAFSSPSVPVEGRNGSKVYTVLAVRAITSPGDTMTCHGIPFPYKVFLCHALVPTKVYSVTIESDGSVDKEKIEEALVVCHLNTAEFDPTKMPPHVKPGDAPVCHFLNNDDILWAPAATTLGTQGAAKDIVVAAQ